MDSELIITILVFLSVFLTILGAYMVAQTGAERRALLDKIQNEGSVAMSEKAESVSSPSARLLAPLVRLSLWLGSLMKPKDDNEIIAVLALSPSTVSKHLFLLKSAGLVRDRKEKKWVHYSLDRGSSDPYVAGILRELSSWLDRLATGVFVANLMRLPQFYPRLRFTIAGWNEYGRLALMRLCQQWGGHNVCSSESVPKSKRPAENRPGSSHPGSSPRSGS